jgi:photosystem II stability/assembly factor-like uncharacterized protein
MTVLKATLAGTAALLSAIALAGCGHGTKHASDDTPTTPAGSASPAAPQLATGAPQVPTHPVPAGFHPYSVTVVGQIRYLLGGAGGNTALIRSTDGGRTWAGVIAPAAPLGVTSASVGNAKNTVHDVRFGSLRDGWAYGGALYATHDGGASWHQIDIGGSVLDLAVSGNSVYALAANCTAACTNLHLMTTLVTSDSWQAVPGLDTGAGSGALAVTGTIRAAIAGQAVYQGTGKAWSRTGTSPCQSDNMAASAAGTRLVVYCADGAAGSSYLSAYYSDDHGASWRKASATLRVPSGHESTTVAGPSTLLVATTNPDTAGGLWRTTDAGQHWSQVETTNWWYVGATTSSDLVGLPAGTSGSWAESHDGGRTWTAHRLT